MACVVFSHVSCLILWHVIFFICELSDIVACVFLYVSSILLVWYVFLFFVKCELSDSVA